MLLIQHLDEVHNAAGQILDVTGDDQLRALSLEPTRYRDRFRRCVLLAAALHDLGKANDHFQGMICGTRNVQQNPQGMRHEWVTVVLLREMLRAWLLPAVNGEDCDLSIVEWAVGGHHPAYGRASPPRNEDGPRGEGDRVSVLTNHRDFTACLRLMADRFPIGPPPEFQQAWSLPLIGPSTAFEAIAVWYRKAQQIWANLADSDKRLVAAVKAAVIAADVAGSALPQQVQDETARSSWIPDAFSHVPRAGEIAALVHKKIAAERERRNDPTIELREFQRAIGNSSAAITFAKAGCGSGKTLAAYLWAANNHPTKRLYFCYPTTGTATEGFRDYLHNPDAELNYRLFHGRAEVDMVLIVRGDEQTPEADAAVRIESLDAWSTPVVSCTVDTVLGLVQNFRRGLYAWPALAGAAFVFDEIHAYDDKLFGALLRFLENLPGLPVLLMTASLPSVRLTALRNCLARMKRDPMAEIGGPEELETRLRYHREASPKDIARRVRAEFAEGGKVLWVSNTVNRAMAAAESIADLRPAIYHSRFRYCDRVKRHAAVIDAFKTDGPAVACSTQVAEMSLDLSATLLITELAPVPALIQRLGRLNRRAKSGDPTQPFIVLDVGVDHPPYSPADFDAARKWLAALPAGEMSQRDLASAWEQHDAGAKPNYTASAWLDCGPSTRVGELRAASSGITVIRDEDAADVRSGAAKIAEVALPMPPPPARANWREWESVKGMPIAPIDCIDYDPLRGASWRK